MWPQTHEIVDGVEASDQFSTMDSLSRAIAQDAMVELQSSLVISLGQESSCIGEGDSMWTRIIAQCQSLMEEKTVCTMSLVEVLEDRDNFRDLLNSDNTEVTTRHVDMNGAILENLTQVPIDSVPGLLPSLSKRKHPNSTIVGTISLWGNAVSYELKKSPSSEITCVEMVGMPKTSGDTRVNLEDTAVHRKGTVSLGRALRQLLLYASVGTEPVISYRETTVTKVLQRALESSKIVLLASVSQLSQDYEFTLVTLNYLRRLLVKPGKTAASPFKSDELIDRRQTPMSASSHNKLHDLANGPYLLEQIVTDPRQRLAKIFKQSHAPKDAEPINFMPSEEEYRPIDYMDYDQAVQDSALQIPEDFVIENCTSDADYGLPARLATFVPSEEECRSIDYMDYDRGVEESAMQIPEELVKENGHGDARHGFPLRPANNLSDPIDDFFDREEINRVDQGLRDDSKNGFYSDGTPRGTENTGGDGMSTASDSARFDHDQNNSRVDNAGEHVMPVTSPLDYDERIKAVESPLGKYVGHFGKDDLKVVGTAETSIEYLTNHEHVSELERISGLHDVKQMNLLEWNSDQADDENDSDLGSQPQPEQKYLKQSLLTDKLEVKESGGFAVSRPSESIKGRFFSSPSQGSGRGGIPSDLSLNEELNTKKSAPDVDQMHAAAVFDDSRSTESTGNVELSFSGGNMGNHTPLRATSYAGEIEILEGTVNQIQTMHKGLWESSATSLTRLKETLRSQHTSMKIVAEEKEELASSVASLMDGMKRLSDEHDEHIQAYEVEVEELRDRLDQVLDDKAGIERIADEAISSQAGLEEELEAARDDVLRATQVIETIQKEKLSLVKGQEELKAEIAGMTYKLTQADIQQEQTESFRLEQELSIEHLQRDRAELQSKVADNGAQVEGLRDQLRRHEQSVYDLQKQNTQLEELRRDDRTHLEGLESKSRRFGMSLDNIEKERSRLEDLRRRDTSTIQTLRNDLQRIQIAGVDLKTELAGKDVALAESQDKAAHLENDCQHSRVRIEELERDLQHFRKLRSEETSELEGLRQKLEKWTQSFEVIQSERSHTEQLRRDDQAAIDNLQTDLARTRDRLAKAEGKHCEQSSNLKNLVGKMKMDLDLKGGEIERCNHEIQDLKERLSSSRDRERYVSTNADKEVLHLRDRLDDCKSELELRDKKTKELVERLNSAHRQETNFILRFEEVSKALEQHRLESVQAKKEISQLRDLGQAESADSKQQIAAYEQHISRLHEELSHSKRQEVPEQNSSSQNSFSHSALTEELTRAKELLNRRNFDVEQLSNDLKNSRSEKHELEERLLGMKSDLHRFQLESKEKIGKVVSYHKDSGKEVQELRSRNFELEAKLQKLEERTEALQHERDSCCTSLEAGRNRIAAIAFKGGVGNTVKNSRSEKVENLIQGSRRGLKEPRLVPDFYLTDSSINQMLFTRAGEIAACLAVRAKNSLQESHDEAFRLKSEVHRLEGKTEAEVSSLKERIRFLENEFVDIEGSKEPSLSRLERRHRIDYTN